MSNLATEIPMDDCGLTINVGRDGTWLHFSSEAGLHASFNVENLAANQGLVFGKALIAWCEDRREQAEQIKRDNGQFGVGA